MVVDINWLTFEDRLGEFEQCHIRPAPWAVDREKPKQCGGDVKEMGIGMRHHFVGFLGCRIERHLCVAFLRFGIGHRLIRAIGGGGRSDQ